MQLVWEISWKYFRAKKENKFIAFGAAISILGISLGVMILITVLSVMNGFDYELHQKIFRYTRPITLRGYHGELKNYANLQKKIWQEEGLLSTPFLLGQAMLLKGEQHSGLILQGIELTEPIPEVLKGLRAVWPKFEEYNLFLGKETSWRLGINLGDKVILVVPKITISAGGIMPRVRTFTVIGFFEEKFGNQVTAYIPLKTAQKLLQIEATGLSINLDDFYKALDIGKILNEKYVNEGYIYTWAHEYATFFQAVRMEKTTLFVILLFIIAVASFNLVASLVVNIYEKKAEIAILRTLGADSKVIMKIFVIYGGIIGAFGVLLGVLGGIPLALKAPQIVQWLEKLLNVQFINEGIYALNSLPSRLLLKDVCLVSAIAFFMSILATLYPAWKATKLDPVEVLRYE